MTLLGNTADISDFEFIQYQPGNILHETLVDNYIAATTIENNSTRKKLKMHLYDDVQGALFLLVHRTDNRIDAMTSCVKYNENGILSAKVWHRLHIKDNVPNTVLDIYFEGATINWCNKHQIHRLWVTFNERSPRLAFWAAARMGERRNASRPNVFDREQLGHIRANWRPHPKLIYEQYTWQYVIFYSPDNTFFLVREEQDISSIASNFFKREYPNATQNWL